MCMAGRAQEGGCVYILSTRIEINLGFSFPETVSGRVWVSAATRHRCMAVQQSLLFLTLESSPPLAGAFSNTSYKPTNKGFFSGSLGTAPVSKAPLPHSHLKPCCPHLTMDGASAPWLGGTTISKISCSTVRRARLGDAGWSSSLSSSSTSAGCCSSGEAAVAAAAAAGAGSADTAAAGGLSAGHSQSTQLQLLQAQGGCLLHACGMWHCGTHVAHVSLARHQCCHAASLPVHRHAQPRQLYLERPPRLPPPASPRSWRPPTAATAARPWAMPGPRPMRGWAAAVMMTSYPLC